MKKKKTVLSSFWGIGLLAMLMINTSVVQAQDDTKTRFGIKGGANLSNLYVNNVTDEKAKIGFHAGVFAKAPINELFAIQPELLYTSAGAKIGSYTIVQSRDVNFNLNYIQLPVLAVATLSAVNIQFGPYVSYLVNANVKNVRVDNNGLPTSSGTARELSRDDFNTIDYGLAGGIAFDLNGFQIGARYNYGLREVGKGGIAGTLTNNSKNSVAQLYVGFGF
jgi:hypothetical protein